MVYTEVKLQDKSLSTKDKLMDTYILDLASYLSIIINEPYQEKLIAIGWLNANYPFTHGTVQQNFVERLELFCSNPLLQTFGVRFCTLCGKEDVVKVALSSGNEIFLYGANEIRIPSVSGDKIYAAPDLILHYVLAHNYKPPQEFIDAVLTAPLPGTLEFEEFAIPWAQYR